MKVFRIGWLAHFSGYPLRPESWPVHGVHSNPGCCSAERWKEIEVARPKQWQHGRPSILADSWDGLRPVEARQAAVEQSQYLLTAFVMPSRSRFNGWLALTISPLLPIWSVDVSYVGLAWACLTRITETFSLQSRNEAIVVASPSKSELAKTVRLVEVCSCTREMKLYEWSLSME